MLGVSSLVTPSLEFPELLAEASATPDGWVGAVKSVVQEWEKFGDWLPASSTWYATNVCAASVRLLYETALPLVHSAALLVSNWQ